MNVGKIVQVMGPVVDVEFKDGELPSIQDALKVNNGGKECVMEVSQHMGNHIVRCIMLSASEGLCRDMEVTATGSGIQVPVGDQVLGRLFNVLDRRLTVRSRWITRNTGRYTGSPPLLRSKVQW